jgi:hypothetical protein
MRDHITESYTADHTITNLNFSVGAGAGAFPTIWHLVQYSNELRDLRSTSCLEVVQTRISREVMRLRDIIIKHPDLCYIANREFNLRTKYPLPKQLISDPFFTRREVARLHCLANDHVMAKSIRMRRLAQVACPLGHVAVKFEGTSSTYMMKSLGEGCSKPYKENPPFCRICDRMAFDGYHCAFCQYVIA